MEESAALRSRGFIAIAAAAIALRAIILVIVCACGRLLPGQYARLYDGNSYLITASAMAGDRSGFNDFHGRVFPGFPAMIALAHAAHLPMPAAAVGIDWICAAATAVLAARLFNDRRVGWAMVMLIPHYLMNSAMALSEAPLLAFSLAGLLLIRRNRMTGGGALLGIAGLVRPMACFALLGAVVAESIGRSSWLRRLFNISILTGAAGAVVFAGLILVHHWRGDALAGARYYVNSPNTYDGQLLTWPFHALLMVPGQRHVPASRVAYLWAHAILSLMACGVMARVLIRPKPVPEPIDWRDALAAPWLWGNTLFALCIGSVWGFECFHRFTIPAMPAMFWALRAILPMRAYAWMIIAFASTLMAVLTVLHDVPGAG